jgi:hypothetical protein
LFASVSANSIAVAASTAVVDSNRRINVSRSLARRRAQHLRPQRWL